MVASMTERIETVLGPIDPDQLGPTLAHEHLLFDLRCLWFEPPPERAYLIDAEPTLANRGELSRDSYFSKVNLHQLDPQVATEEIARVRDVGVRSIIDLTTIGLAPNPGALKAISEASGVQVVAGAGYYRTKCLPPEVLEKSVEELADELLSWATDGMAGSTVKAGILGELGTGSPIHPFEERQLRAAARVQRQTGVGINVHPQLRAHEHLRVIDILEEEGADLGRVAISHCDQLVEPAWHAQIAERGVFLCFDTFGSEDPSDFDGGDEPHDHDRMDCLRRLLDAGRASQLLVSQDVCTRLQLRRYGGWGYDHVFTSILPRLRRAGVGEAEIDAMVVANPRRLLTIPG